MRDVFPLALAAVLAALLVIGFIAFVEAHEAPSGMVYDAWCCNGNRHNGDCQPIPSHSVRPIQGGFQVTLRPGDHWMVTEEHVFTVAYSDARLSTDGQFHACLYPTQETLRCFYMPPMGS